MAGETVLIIEDRRENIVHLANNVLKPNGYEVITAMDGHRGLQRILKDNPDLVILDMNMPRMDGLEVLAALQERKVDIPVILSTFYGSEQVAEQALHLGAVDYVVKPYQVEEMLAAVQKALVRRPPTIRPIAPLRELEAMMPLTRQVERWMRDMNILTRVGKALVALLDMELVCSRTVEAAIYVTRSDYGMLFKRTEDGGLQLCAMRGPQDRHTHCQDVQISDGLVMHVAKTNQPLRYAENPGDVSLFEIVGEGLGPLAAVPLHYRRQTTGVLLAARSRGEAPFSESDLEWLSGLADYAAIAAHNAQTYAQKGAEPTKAQPDAETVANLRQQVADLTSRLAMAMQAAQRLGEQVSLLGGDNKIDE